MVPVYMVLLLNGYDLLATFMFALAAGTDWIDGQVATTFLFVGFAGLLLNMPLIGGLGWFEASWLPGFGSEACSWGIWFVYAGLLLGLFTTLYYVLAGYRKMQKARRLDAKGRVR